MHGNAEEAPNVHSSQSFIKGLSFFVRRKKKEREPSDENNEPPHYRSPFEALVLAPIHFPRRPTQYKPRKSNCCLHLAVPLEEKCRMKITVEIKQAMQLKQTPASLGPLGQKGLSRASFLLGCVCLCVFKCVLVTALFCDRVSFTDNRANRVLWQCLFCVCVCVCVCVYVYLC